jgi:hypothetical protein
MLSMASFALSAYLQQGHHHQLDIRLREVP